MECAFCKIYNQKLPAKIIYQDNILSCFLPRNMEVYGHLLVIPNKHFENIFDIPEEELTHIIKFTKKISLHLKECLGATGINILHASGKSAQQSVPSKSPNLCQPYNFRADFYCNKLLIC